MANPETVRRTLTIHQPLTESMSDVGAVDTVCASAVAAPLFVAAVVDVADTGTGGVGASGRVAAVLSLLGPCPILALAVTETSKIKLLA